MPKGDRTRSICSVDDCDGLVKAWGLCRNHGRRLMASDPEAYERLRAQKAPHVGICLVSDCDKPTRAKGLCSLHHSRWRSTGTTEKINRRRTCIVENCGELVHGLGYCSKHWWRFKKYDDPLFVTNLELRTSEPTECSVDDCGRDVSARGWCKYHYMRWWMYTNPEYPDQRAARRKAASVPSEKTTWAYRWERNIDRDGPMPIWRLDLGQCWVWNGTKQSSGHGQITVDGRLWQVHRLAWEFTEGRIPRDGTCLDHLCRRTNCIRPEHLEPVTLSENSRRRMECARCLFFNACPCCRTDLSSVVPAPGLSRTFSDWQSGVKCRDLEQYFWSHIEMVGGAYQPLLAPGSCWDWMGQINESGYGIIPRHKYNLAHRFAVQLYGGDLSGGLHVDHLCGRRSCQAPLHLEVVTRNENSRRRHVCRRCRILDACPSCAFPIAGIGSASDAMGLAAKWAV